MSLVPTPAQIRAQVAAVWGKAPDARVIGIRAPASVETGEALRINGKELPVARCESVLEIRERLAGHEGAGSPLVLLTPLEEAELGSDLIARLAKRHLFLIEPWQLVKERFHARYVDPRLVERHPWVARALLEAEPDGGYPPAASSFIEAELAWRILFEALVGLPGGQRDPETLLEWTIRSREHSCVAALGEEIREGLCQAVHETTGQLAGRIFEAVISSGKNVLAVGLVARTLYGPSAAGDLEAIRASGKLESYLGARELDEALAQTWADAAEAVIERRLTREALSSVRPLIAQGDELLAALGAIECAHRSRFLGSGYEQRLTRYARELAAFVDAEAKSVRPSLWEAGDSVLEHVLSVHEAARSERTEMALRLAEWLAELRAEGDKSAGSFAAAARAYRQVGGFADWARTRIWDGDPLASLGQAYTRLSEAVGVMRERQNCAFGQLFANWSETGSRDTSSLLVVEDVLDRVIAPLATKHPVLLAVIDGMGIPVFRELQADLFRSGWIEVVQSEAESHLPVIAGVPSVTEVSRASLLCGKLTTGKQNVEKNEFSKHSGLVACSEASKPPVLFHKGDLNTSGAVGLAPEVVREILDLRRRVVGVVINAVDDHLAKGEQVRVDWSGHRIRPLEELLLAARDAGRVVVLVSDHGHVLEHQTESRRQGDSDSDRWREDDGKPDSDEVVVQGPRVLLGKSGRVIAPWSERVRFGSKKNGYHGGGSPQEVVIPLAIFVPAGLLTDSLHEAPPETPDWWERPESSGAMPPKKPVVAKPAPPKVGETGRFFPTEEEEAQADAAVATGAVWIDALLASDQMAAQRAHAARTHLSDDRLREILAALDERGGKLTRAALAKRLSVPTLRIGGILSALRRVLNVEGYAVLSVDEASDTVVLNRTLLDTQFGL